MDVIEAMETCSAARYLKPDPVPQDLIERVIYAATRASSPGNSQAWDFIVVRDRELKQKIRDLIAPRFQAMRASAPAGGQVTNKMLAGATHLADSLHEVPAIILVCGPVAYPPNAPREQFVWSALYPAAQKPYRGRPLARFGNDFHHLSHVHRIRTARPARNSRGSAIRRDDSHRMATRRVRQGQAEADCQGHSLGQMERLVAVTPAQTTELTFEQEVIREPDVSGSLRSNSRYSDTASPDPPNSVGKSLSFGNPSFIGRTVSA